MNSDKLQKLQSQVRIGGKGTPRRKIKKQTKVVSVGEDKKLQQALKKFNVQTIPQIEEVNMFKQDGRVIHFKLPNGIHNHVILVQASIHANVFTITGHSEEKDLTELVPGILTQMGPESLNALRKLAEQFQKTGVMPDVAAGASKDDDVPELEEIVD